MADELHHNPADDVASDAAMSQADSEAPAALVSPAAPSAAASADTPSVPAAAHVPGDAEAPAVQNEPGNAASPEGSETFDAALGEAISERDAVQGHVPEEAAPELSKTLAQHKPLDPRDPAPAASILDDDDSAAAAYEALERSRAAKRRKRFLKIGIALAVVAAAVGVWWFMTHRSPSSEEQAYVPQTAMVARGDLRTEVSASGSLKPYASVAVTPEVEGIVEAIYVSQDQVVNAGDVLFSIKNDELDRAIETAAQSVRSAERDLANAQRQLDATYQAEATAWSNYQADPEAYPYDTNAQTDAIESARQAVETATQSLETARKGYDDAVNTAAKRAVRASASGTIISMNLQVGQAISASSSSIMQIADVSQMRVNIQVNEIDIDTIAKGQRAIATFSAIPDFELEGKVVRIASVATGMEGDAIGFDGGGIANFSVEIIFPQPDKRLKPGMTAKIAILTQDVPDALIAPAEAVTNNGDGTGTAERVTNSDPENFQTETVELKLGEANSEQVVILEGLNEGDELLVGGAPAMPEDGEDGGVTLDEAAVETLDAEIEG